MTGDLRHTHAPVTRITSQRVVRRALLLSLAVLGCTPPAETVTPPQPQEQPQPRKHSRRAPSSRSPTDSAINQALLELERSPRLHVIVLGPDAAPVHKAMLRAARGRVDDRRIRAEPEADGAPGRGVEFRFFVPPADDLERDGLE